MTKFDEIIRDFQGKLILIIGDVYLEKHLIGQTSEMSIEGAVPVVNISSEKKYAGGAGHVAAAVKALGGHVKIAGVIGNDPDGLALQEILQNEDIDTSLLQLQHDVETNIVKRIMTYGAHQPYHEVFRINIRSQKSVSDIWQQKIIDELNTVLPKVQAVIVIEKENSWLTPAFIQQIRQLTKTHNVIAVGDSDFNRRQFKGYDLLVCNDREAGETVGYTITDEFAIEKATNQLVTEIQLKNVAITRGAAGISVAGQDVKIAHIPTEALPIFDSTGAGDNVTATLTAGIVGGGTLVEAARLANYAASLAVSQAGLAITTANELIASISRESAMREAEKITTVENLRTIAEKARRQGRRVVWTNGCFDLMHVGHILYLQYAKKQGDILMIGLNSDKSVSRIKGPKRPIVEESQRARLLASLYFIDYVVLFSDPSPLKLIGFIKPDIYVKGGDYTIDTINQEERHFVEGYGGEIAIMPGVDGMSTTNLIQKILESEKDF